MQTASLLPEKKAPTILFVCGANAARSQIASALFKDRVASDAVVLSAGLKAATEISPSAKEVMNEVGVSLDSAPKQISKELVDAADVIVAVGCGAAHDEFRGKTVLDWHVDDPKGQPIEQVRKVRDGISHLVDDLIEDVRKGKFQGQ